MTAVQAAGGPSGSQSTNDLGPELAQDAAIVGLDPVLCQPACVVVAEDVHQLEHDPVAGRWQRSRNTSSPIGVGDPAEALASYARAVPMFRDPDDLSFAATSSPAASATLFFDHGTLGRPMVGAWGLTVIVACLLLVAGGHALGGRGMRRRDVAGGPGLAMLVGALQAALLAAAAAGGCLRTAPATAPTAGAPPP